MRLRNRRRESQFLGTNTSLALPIVAHGQFTLLASPICWSLHGNLGFTYTDSCCGLLDPLCIGSNHVTHCLTLPAFWNLSERFHDPSLLYFATIWTMLPSLLLAEETVWHLSTAAGRSSVYLGG